MNIKYSLITLTVFVVSLQSCNNSEIRNIANIPQDIQPPKNPLDNKVEPVDINEKGLDFLAHMQGQWIGSNRVIADDYDWFTFDYRAISSSQTHGIFEGGTFGNLFTSFFVTDFNNKRTIMARNGGVLNGIYRTSYFVLDSVRSDYDGDYYRFVDAVGGAHVMYTELRFKQDSLYWNAYTSRLGVNAPSTRHMTFKAVRSSSTLYQDAANYFGYPKNEVAFDFSNGFNTDYLSINPGQTDPSSATFLAQGNDNSDVINLAFQAGDPYRIDQHPTLSTLQINIDKMPLIDSTTLFINLSEYPLTDNQGYLDVNAFNSVLLFPQLDANENQFTVTYLHPGDYYVTIISDANYDGSISVGDITHVSQQITIAAESQQQITISNITVQN